MRLSLESRIREIYKHPVGHDILSKLLLQLGRSEKLITNPIVGSLKLKTIQKLAGKRLDTSFFESILTLLNSEDEVPAFSSKKVKPTWWKEAVFYQIYPRSFKDSNHDGIGDLQGIIEKLDYLQSLGVTALWLSPIYDSPNDDNGYDIRNYQAIMKEFGTMADFEELLSQVHARGMRLIMDLVVNHTSDEHPWFQEALQNPESRYRDYYFFRKSRDGKAPNNWLSFFSGSAWNHYPERDDWVLHLFSKKQMDLNWDNSDVRRDIISMVNWWLEKGIDGFRMDVINYISKAKGLPDGNETINALMGYRGIEHYFYGPHLHDYLHQIKTEAFLPHGAFSVGETPGVGMQMSQLLSAESREELDMVFDFDQLETPGHVRFDDYRYDLNYLKSYLMDWQINLSAECWMSLFYENHDNPRMISKVNPDPQYRAVLAKLLALIQMTLKGTPFIFQGQELGLVNQRFTGISDFRDVESLNLYKELCEKMPEKEAFEKVLAGSRDHARVPMPWNADDFGGFSDVMPWLLGDGDYKEWNAAEEMANKDSVLQFYQKLIALRKAEKSLVYGEINWVKPKLKNYVAYTRTLGDKSYFIECNLGCGALKRKVPENARLIMTNVRHPVREMSAYEASIYQII
ncbi:MAG: alpha-glucosidase [Streptococcaceae bacterium]|jgi:oligo-1,6-glucosidase|nr:alpha-glucosidase [Streptococcaceae bacterium]